MNDFKFPKIWSENNNDKIILSRYFKIHGSGKYRAFVYWYRPDKMIIDFDETKHFCTFLHSVPTNDDGINVLPIIVDLNNLKFADKLVYIIFETIINHIIFEKNWIITIVGNVEPENCSNAVQHSSLNFGNLPSHIFEIPLSILLKNPNFYTILKQNNLTRYQKYKYNRIKNKDIAMSRYFVSSLDKHNNHSNSQSDLHASDIYAFIIESKELIEKNGGNCGEIANTIFEIIANCVEHANYQYVYDIDIKQVTHGKKSKLTGRKYVAINIAIWDFSNANLGDAVKKKILNIETCASEAIYLKEVGKKEHVFKKLLDIKKFHEQTYNSNALSYDINDFFALSAFQPGVTGRSNPGNTGGAGLAHVLDFLREFSDDYRCYCITGDTIINLDRKFLNKDADGWYSFNEDGSATFDKNIPSENCISKSKIFYPGTAYFLHLELNGGTNEQ